MLSVKSATSTETNNRISVCFYWFINITNLFKKAYTHFYFTRCLLSNFVHNYFKYVTHFTNNVAKRQQIRCNELGETEWGSMLIFLDPSQRLS